MQKIYYLKFLQPFGLENSIILETVDVPKWYVSFFGFFSCLTTKANASLSYGNCQATIKVLHALTFKC